MAYADNADAAGDILVADSGNHRIQVFNPDHSFKFQFGSSGTGDGQFNTPRSTAIAQNGDILVVDSGNHRVQIFNSDGTYKAKIGSSTSGAAGSSSANGEFDSPRGITITSGGDILVADTGNNRIQVFNPDYSYKSKFGSTGSGNGQLISPYDITVTPSGDILVSDYGNQRIHIFDSSYAYKAKFINKPSRFAQAQGSNSIAVGADGDILVSSGLGYIGIFDSVTYAVKSSLSSNLNQVSGIGIRGIAVAPNGDILFTDTGRHHVQVFGSDYVYKAVFGSSGSGDGQFNTPYGITVVTADNTPPKFDSATLDEETGVLAVTFNEIIANEGLSTAPFDLSKLFISETGSASGSGVQLSGASIETVGNSTSIEIKLTAPQLQSVIALTTPELDILEAAVFDVSGNQIAAAPDNVIVVTADNTPPKLESATLNEETGILAITFDEIIAASGFDLSIAAHERALSVSSQDASLEGVVFSTDGTKMFVVGYSSENIYEYTLTAPFDISDPTHTDTFSVSLQDTDPKDVAFSTDGTKMFVVGYYNENIYEYTLTASFDISAPNHTDTFSVSSQDSSLEGMAFNPAGTKMFVVSTSNDNVSEYTLTAPFNISAPIHADTFSVSSQDTSPTDVAFNPAGTKMFVVGTSNDNVSEYTLTAPFNISAPIHADNSFSVALQEDSPRGVAFNPAGTKMFVVGTGSYNVNEYTLATPAYLSKLFISESGSASGSSSGVQLSGASIETVGNSISIEIKMTEDQRQSVILLTTPELDILEAAVFDVSGNQIGAAPDNVIVVTNSVVPPPLAAPTGHSVAVSGTTATITWTAPAISANLFYDISNVSYIVNVTDVAAGTTVPYTISDGTITTYAVTNLTPGKSYQITVKAQASLSDSTILSSQPTAVVSFDMPIPPPPNKSTNLLVSVINGTAAEITWTAPTVDDNDFYTIDDISYTVEVYNPGIYDRISEHDGRTTGTSYTITGLTSGESYRIVVYAVVTVANYDSLESFAHVLFNMPAVYVAPPVPVVPVVPVPPPPLDAPTDLSVAVSGTTATITWTAPAILANSFYDINSVSYLVNVTDVAADRVVQYTISDGTTTTHTATNLTPDKSYEVTVEAQALLSDSTVLSSQPTAAVSFAVSEPPSLDAPTNLLVNVINGTAAEITWTAPTVDDTNDFYTINDVTYQVNILDSLNAFTASSRSITATSYTATNLTPGESYNVFVSADAAVGSSYIVQSVGVSAPFDMPAAAVVVDSGGAGTPPSPDHPQVQNLEIEKTGDQKVTLTWEAPANSGNKEFLHYSVSYKCYATGDDYTKISTGFTFVSIDNLDINGLCEFNVTPIYSDASGKNSQIISTTPLKDILIAVTPDDIRLTAAMDGSDAIKVSWLPISSDVFAYDLAWNDPSEGSSQFVPFGTKHFVDGDRSTSHIIKDVKPGYTYTIALTLLYYGTDADSELVPRVIIIEYTVPDLAVAVPPPPLDAPTNLAVAVQGTEATITWTAPVIPANSFYTIDDISYTVEVYNPGIYDRISEHDGRTTGTSYTITGLTSGESYRIVVYAVVTVANHGLLESFAHVLFDMPAVLPVPVVPVVPVPPSADSTPPTFESATLDEETGVLAITFDEIIANEGFDLSTAAHTDRSFSVGTQETSPTGMAFSTDGTKMFVAGAQHDRVYEYTLSVPFDVSTLSFVDDPFSVSAQDATPADVAFNTNGTKMFVVGNAGGEIHEYTLDTPFDVSSSVFAEDSFPVSDRDASPTGMAFSTNGTKMFVIGAQYDRVYEYTLSVPFDVSSSVFADVSFPVSDQDTTPADVAFNTDGTKMFVVGNAGDAIHEYALSAPFDISAPTHADTFSVSLQDANPTGVAFNPAGTKMFVVGATGGDIHEYALASSLDLSKLFISESGNTNDISLTGASIETVGNSDSIEIELTASQRESVIALTTPQLDILKGAVSDVSGNQIDASPDNHITITGTGRSSGGGSSSSSSTESTPPSFPTTSFDGKTNTIFIGTVGISPEPSRLDYTLDNPVLVQTGQSIPISLTMHDNMSWESISHVELCLNKQISNNQICDSDTKLVWDKKYNDGNNNDNNSNSLKIIDPNGLIENASVSIAKVDVRVATWDYSVTFGKAMDTSDIQIYAWDDRRNALTFTIHNALTVTAQNDAQGSSSSSDTASSSSGGSSSSSSGGSSSSSSGGSSSSSSSSSSDDTITSSCDAGKLLLDTGLCMDPEPGTFACLSEQVMNHDGTCLDASKTAIAQDDKVIKLLPPSSDTQSTDAIKKQNEMVKRWAGYSEFSATDAELIKSLGITNDLPPDVSLPKWIKKHLGEMVYKNQISVEQLKTVLSYMVGVLK